ncbi:hypothetical protein [Kyrpidia tusciae]|uniref:hypothetical protein n=1 Tax=Kyrpidia tusciae TaxID=33943 RepID=UPI0002F6F132|nr:hypothetical protein [Kyrpidia tusciae]
MRNRLKQDWKAGAWSVVCFESMLVIAHLGDYQLPAGVHPVIPSGWDDLIVAIGALVIYY